MTGYVGVDWAGGCWVVVEYGSSPRITTEPSILNVWAEHEEAQAIIVDVPIGLTPEGPRECDGAARRVVGPRSGSVFAPPAREVLDKRQYDAACDANAGFDGLGSQAWWIVPTIREVQVFLNAHPEARAKVHEGHPEVSFADLNPEGGDLNPKSSEDGRKQRLRILEGSDLEPEANDFGREIGDFVEGRGDGGEWHHRIRSGRLGDVVDAAALALTARAAHLSGYPTLPEDGDVEEPPVIVRPQQK